MDSKVILPGEGKSFHLHDIRFGFGVVGDETDGRLALIEVTIPPGTLVKPHQHSHEDEYTAVLTGSVGIRLGELTYENVPAGSFLVKPRAVPHAMWNANDEPASIVEVVSPAGFERYVEELAPVLREHGPEWTQRFYEIAARYGITVLDDWVEELEQRHGVKL